MTIELNPALVKDLWNQAGDIFSYIKDLRTTWPVIGHLNKANETITQLRPVAAAFQHYTDIVILGTGGSSLGGQALTALGDNTNTPKLHFIDNIDSTTFHGILTHLNPATTGVLTISKSGNTAETLMQTLTLLQTWQTFQPATQMRIITENKPNAMRDVAATYNIPCLDHPNDVGGRFSVFTIVGLLPAMIKGLNVSAFCEGALEAFQNAESATVETCQALAGALIQVAHKHQGISTTVLFAYSNQLSKFCEWFAQLWAESLGKKDAAGTAHGTTPVKAIGAIDQHSQLQLYLGGPRDKFFTFLTTNNHYPLAPITLPATLTHPSVTALNNRSMGDLMIAEQNATLDTMRHHGCPLRHITIEKIDEANLGSLMMYFMLETLAAARFWNVDPFDQPAVEEGKVLAIEYLNKAE
ncbi:MAG: glucose-6-phosphate isomerase [Pseudomonadota bacterium]